VTEIQATIDDDTALDLVEVFGVMAEMQAEWQRRVGFGAEGDELRFALADEIGRRDMYAARGPLWSASVEEAEENVARAATALRNYYIAKLALITTEVAEAIEEIRTNHAIDETYYPTRDKFEQTPGALEELGIEGCVFKPEGVPSELADVVIRCFSLAGEAGIPLGAMVVEKLRYNETRALRHGGKAI
jgi:NTP pyrophosphatase (non-canonical NTP hydrolase)